MATNSEQLNQKYRIALIHDSLTVPGGAEKVLYELHRMFPGAPIYTPFFKPERFPEFKDAKVIPSSLNRFRFLRNRHQLSFPLQPYAIEQFDLSGYDLVISDSSAMAKGVLTRPETVHICYCHTPMRWAWMPYLDKRASSSFIRRVSAHYLRLWDQSTINRVDYWLANSKTAASRVKKFYHQEAKVIYPPASVSQKTDITDEGFYLTVGRLVESKRPDIIVEAAKKLNLPLKVVGEGPMKPTLETLAKGSNSITFLGRVNDEMRDHLYATCHGFIFAAEEDAGIVPIEAMAFGKPVICFGRGGAAETVVSGKTGLHFNEQTTASLVSALQDFSNHNFKAETIQHHAQQFSPERFKREILRAINHALHQRKPADLPGKDD